MIDDGLRTIAFNPSVESGEDSQVIEVSSLEPPDPNLERLRISQISAERTDIKRIENGKVESPVDANKLILEYNYSQGSSPGSSSSNRGQMIIRVHFGSEILKALENIQKCAGSPRAAIYAKRIVRNSRALFEKSYSDPFVEIVMCLHDALLFDSGWALYSSGEYQKAHEILYKACQDSNLNQKKIESFIISLSDAGFDIFAANIGFI